MASLNDEQIKELCSLIDWLHTFDVFLSQNVNSAETRQNPNKAVEQLSSSEVTRAISKIAEEVCESQVEVDTNATGQSERIWTSLLMLTSTRARPLQKESNKENDSRMSPARLKLYVLSNLLDCAVQSPNMNQRRQYIERIMGLDKAVQKTLMSLIERRNRRTPKKKTPVRPKSPPTSKAMGEKKRLTFESPVANEMSSVPRSNRSSVLSRHSYPIEASDSNTSQSTPIQSNVTPERPKASLRKQIPTGTPSGYTPDTKRSHITKQVENVLLSPGTMESPDQVQMIVRELRQRNARYEGIVEKYKQREQSLQTKLETLEAKHRTEMMKLEKKAFDREEDLVAKYKNHIETLKEELRDVSDKASRGERAVKELKKANEEIELLTQNKEAIPEMTEKLRKYKEKVLEFQDIKEALAREQEAHGNSVDVIVRLENELQALAPLKQQLEDYKIRAIEAEVKLAETQDSLKKMELKAQEQSDANEYLWKGAMMQKEQMEELQRRLKEDSQSKDKSGPGVGQGVSELNPELMEELHRLRGENKQLREFAEKRSNDAVQKMTDTIDDSRRLSEKYKQQFFTTKEKLEATQETLSQTEERERKLIREVKQLRDKVENLQLDKNDLSDRLKGTEETLSSTRSSLQESSRQNAELRGDVDQWMEKFNETEKKSSLKTVKLNELSSQLESTKSALSSAETASSELRKLVSISEEKIVGLERTNDDLEAHLDDIGEKFETSEKGFAKAREDLQSMQSQITKHEENINQLSNDLDRERQAMQEAAEEHHRDLEATREVLQGKSQKELHDLETHLNKLLEQERRASREAQEEMEARIRALEADWKNEYDDLEQRSSIALSDANQESQQQIENLQREYQAELSKQTQEAEAARENLVRKGKAMISEAKQKAKEELQKMYEENQSLVSQLNNLTGEKEDEKELMEGQVKSLKNQLDFANAQTKELSNDVDNYQEKIRSLERENFDIKEDNERCRRQLLGSNGSGSFQEQFEQLKQEYETVLSENRELKKKSRYGGALGSIAESRNTESEGSYGRMGGMTNEKLREIKAEYDNHISNLMDEKRELLMKNYSAAINVEKAVQRATEKEDQIARLNDVITSLKLQVQRQELTNDDTVLEDAVEQDAESTNHDHSFFKTDSQETDKYNDPSSSSLAAVPRTPPRPFETRSYEPSSISSRTCSPGVQKAKREKDESESAFRHKLYSLTNSSQSTSRVSFKEQPNSDSVLVPTLKHEQQSNRSQHVSGFGIGSDYSMFEPQTDKKAMSRSEPSTSYGLSADYRPLKFRQHARQGSDSSMSFGRGPEHHSSSSYGASNVDTDSSFSSRYGNFLDNSQQAVPNFTTSAAGHDHPSMGSQPTSSTQFSDFLESNRPKTLMEYTTMDPNREVGEDGRPTCNQS